MNEKFYTELGRRLKLYDPFKRCLARIASRDFPLYIVGPRGGLVSVLTSLFQARANRPFLIIVPTDVEAEQLLTDLETFGASPAFFPWSGTAPYTPPPRNSTAFGRRCRVLNDLATGRAEIVIAPLRAAISPVPPPEYLRARTIDLVAGGALDPIAVADRLTTFGYTRVPRVSVRGEFALRGEVLDVFCPGDDHPIRTVFEFDTVEEIRSFETGSQSSVQKYRNATIVPCREVVWDPETIASFQENIASAHEIDAAVRLDILESLTTRGTFDGEEVYYPLVGTRSASIHEYLPEQGVVVYVGFEKLVNTAVTVEKEFSAAYRTVRVEKRYPRPERLILPVEEVTSVESRAIRFHSLVPEQNVKSLVFSYEPAQSYFGNVTFLKEELGALEKAGYTVAVYAESESQRMRVAHLLNDFSVIVVADGISSGFAIPELKIRVIAENEIFGRRRHVPRSVHKTESAAIDTFVELDDGDYVVHVSYGIGRYCGIKRIAAAGNERDYIQLEYAGEEFIYIPIEQVNLIQRYIGQSGNAPRLDTIGGKSWENRKSKVKKNVEDLADRLIALYSRRKRAQGHAFPTDAEWQYDFEATFPYEETDDQLQCIADVKHDMEAPTPMDRLICGDVGYGKTEVALRAAFKAVTSGKQVAILAPTTILAEQHYETFVERVQRFPVRVGMLSRFVAKPEQKVTLTGLADGSVEVVVGTHRILQKDVSFRDLGLIVVDEEQRFGVKDKERLKELKASVDCLTLTATPIPRTLHMALLKIRDMSVLKTPPHNRLPIETFIQEFSEELVADAVRKEVARGGQVYYLHNRIESLDEIRSFLEKMLPEVMVETAHGKMAAHELENIMHRFIHGGFHVLVATTIIENGIDIPNVNTIVIDRADMYGISQLYQLRGRVGRSDRPAYAYLFYPERRALSELAMKRLQIISDYTELGSGFKIALKDMEVRGAGNLLGAEQSGDILSVGFDMYLRLLDEAMRKRDADSADGDEPPEVYLELEYSGFIPDTYIDTPSEKMEVYKKIASIGNEEELEAVYAEVVDRYGPLPDEVLSLLSLAEIRIIARKLFISTVRERAGRTTVEFGRVAKVSVQKILRLIETSGGKVRLDPKSPNVLTMDTGTVGLKEKSEFLRGKLSTLL